MKKYILVTGGELRNKGAQAMTFITVDQIAKKFPECHGVWEARNMAKHWVSGLRLYLRDLLNLKVIFTICIYFLR